MKTPAAADGRNARRERNRVAVIEAAFALVREGKTPPAVDDIAERAGVSVSSIFRNFDGLADLQRQALDLAHEMWSPSFEVNDADQPLDVRIRSHVRSRVELFDEGAALMRIGRARALDHEPMVAGVARLRARFADQTRARFATEIEQLTPATAADLVAIIDTTTSPEAYDLMAAAHSRTSRQISRAWIAALTLLMNQPAQSEEP